MQNLMEYEAKRDGILHPVHFELNSSCILNTCDSKILWELTPRKAKSRNFGEIWLTKLLLIGSLGIFDAKRIAFSLPHFWTALYEYMQMDNFVLVTPPLKNVRRRRFRKTLKKKVTCYNFLNYMYLDSSFNSFSFNIISFDIWARFV